MKFPFDRIYYYALRYDLFKVFYANNKIYINEKCFDHWFDWAVFYIGRNK